MEQKIRRSNSGFGTVEWTPNSHLQHALQNAEPEYQDFINEFLGNMFEGYFLALTQCFGDEENLAWIKDKTHSLVKEAISRRSG